MPEPQGLMILKSGLSILLRILNPIVPHITQEIWVSLGYGDSILDAIWPVVDEKSLVADKVKMVVQINGKVRAQIEIPAEVGKDEAQKHALANEKVKGYVGGKEPRKIIVVPGKLINIVV